MMLSTRSSIPRAETSSSAEVGSSSKSTSGAFARVVPLTCVEPLLRTAYPHPVPGTRTNRRDRAMQQSARWNGSPRSSCVAITLNSVDAFAASAATAMTKISSSTRLRNGIQILPLRRCGRQEVVLPFVHGPRHADVCQQACCCAVVMLVLAQQSSVASAQRLAPPFAPSRRRAPRSGGCARAIRRIRSRDPPASPGCPPAGAPRRCAARDH